MAYVPGKRIGRKSKKYMDALEGNEEFLASDPMGDSLVLGYDPGSEADFDWVLNVPGRPSPYTTTWSLVYGKRTTLPSGGFTVPCEEGRDGDIQLNGLLQEVNGKSTPHGILRKPPVCHVIPWVLLSVAMGELETLTRRELTDEFKRYVCWGVTSNLQTGHNACNAGGAKVTVLSATTSDKRQAASFVNSCLSTYQSLANPFKL